MQGRQYTSISGVDQNGPAVFGWLPEKPKEKTQGENPGDTRVIAVCQVSTAHDGGVGGDKSILRGTESQVFRGRAAGKRMKTRSNGNKANENPCLVDFVQQGDRQCSSVRFPGSMLLRRWQQLADAGEHAVRKAGNSTPGRKDRLGMTGNSGE